MTASGVPADVHERAVEAAAKAHESKHLATYTGDEYVHWSSHLMFAEATVAAAAPVLAEPYRAEIERLEAALAATLHALKRIAPTEAQRNDEARGIIRRALEARDA